MSTIERRVGPGNLGAPTTIYGAGVLNALSDRGASSGHSGHNYEWVYEYVLDLANETASAEELFADYSANKLEEGAYIEQVEVVVVSAPDGAVTFNATDEAENDVALAALAGTEAAGDILVSSEAGVGAQLAAESVLTYAGAAAEGKVVLRVRFKRPIE